MSWETNELYELFRFLPDNERTAWLQSHLEKQKDVLEQIKLRKASKKESE